MTAMLGASMLGGISNLPILGLFFLSFVFWIWMLVDCATKERGEGNDKLIWVLIILFTHIIGAALYFFIRRPARRAARRAALRR